ncbi:hypothetical protein GTC6_17831 [Gordonia terrae C-6]|uniref:Lipoprotein n=2 Tax=Gordonia TaxID=2053 RepID=R7Y5N8_9ACTN|nr:hypothetical protein KTR9_0165 [Gordonia sp. KTR9]EON31336.1 hypothetical protein GTC6_17831 [Gordonia terrae C-6]
MALTRPRSTMMTTAAATLAAAVMVATSACGGGDTVSNASTPGMPADPTVWQFIDTASAHMPLTQESTSTLLDTPAEQILPRRWETEPITLGTHLKNVASTIFYTDDQQWERTYLKFTPDTCITLDGLKAQYPDITLERLASGHSPKEVNEYGTTRDNTHFIFTIEAGSGCLTGVDLSPKQ